MSEDHMRKVMMTFARTCAMQAWSAFYWFNKLFEEFPLVGALEIGTAHGGTASFFANYFPDRVVTVDQNDVRNQHTADLHRRLGVRMATCDALHPANVESLMSQLQRPCLIFCDNGNKPLEFEIYAKELRSGDVIAVHDNGSEFFADQEAAQKVAAQCGLVRWRREELDTDRNLLAVWRKP